MHKIFASILLSIGFVFLAVTVSVAFTKNPSKEDKSAALGGLIVGVPATASGAWILWERLRKKRESEDEHHRQLEVAFLELVAANQGRVTAINFAIATELSLDEAKQYLDKKATQLNATFDVGDEGGISYHFFM